ncbi:MAG: hypothetical protein ABI266_10625 [Ginsengibacter sp.]
MKYLFIVLTTFLSGYCSAQTYLDYTDTRKKVESFEKLREPNLRADLAAFTLGGIGESVAKEGLTKLTNSSSGIDFMEFDGDSIKAIIRTAPFDTAGHKLTFDDKYLIKIDKKTYFGNYGYIPKNHITNISLIVGRDTVSIPKEAYSDLYDVNLTYISDGVKRTTNAIYRSKTGYLKYLYLFSKGKKESYEVTWIFQNNKYLRRVVNYGLM